MSRSTRAGRADGSPELGGGALLLGAEMRNHVAAEQAQRVEHLLMRCGADGAEQYHLLDPERFIHLDEMDALGRCADAELLAAVTHFARRRLARVGPGGKALIAIVIALVIWRHGVRVVVAPDQAGPLALLLDVPTDEFATTLGGDLRVLMAVAG